MNIKIPTKTSKNKFIYGDLFENKDTDTLVVFLSGLSGSKDLPLFEAATKKFFENGFSTFKFNFCRESESKTVDTLDLKEMIFAVYLSEFKNIIDFFNSDYKNFVLVGHSFGAVLAILFLDTYRGYLDNTSLVLWEPSILPWKREWMEEDYNLDNKTGFYISKINHEIINREFYEETININNIADTLGNLNKNVCIVAAKGSADEDAQQYFKKTKDKINSKLKIIEKTNHFFDGSEAQEELFKTTISFIKD